MQVQSLLGVVVGVGLLTGCPDREISEITPSQERVETNDIPFAINRNIDVLFVIDDSRSMEDKQANLAANFPDFINVLGTIPGGLPDVHIGVATSDMGAKSTTEATPLAGVNGCTGSGKNGTLQLSGAPVTGDRFLSDVSSTSGGRTRNYTGDLATVFAQMAKVGVGGCGFEQHLHAMKAALDGSNPANAGFLRPDAYLAVIFIADEDDCSVAKTSILGPPNATTGSQQSFRCTRFGVTCDLGGATTDAMNVIGTKGQCHANESSDDIAKVQPFVEFLKSLKTDEKKVIVAGIMGPADPVQVEMRAPPSQTVKEQALARSCSYQGATNLEVADPAVRLAYFLDQFPRRSTFTTICQRDLSAGLALIAQLLKDTLVGDPCIKGNLMDVDPDTEGEQFGCTVSDVQHAGTPQQTETILPACDATNSVKPCWHIGVDAARCTTSPKNRMLTIERAMDPPAETHTIMNCVTEASDTEP